MFRGEGSRLSHRSVGAVCEGAPRQQWRGTGRGGRDWLEPLIVFCPRRLQLKTHRLRKIITSQAVLFKLILKPRRVIRWKGRVTGSGETEGI